jgi:hypothetical protein
MAQARHRGGVRRRPAAPPGRQGPGRRGIVPTADGTVGGAIETDAVTDPAPADTAPEASACIAILGDCGVDTQPDTGASASVQASAGLQPTVDPGLVASPCTCAGSADTGGIDHGPRSVSAPGGGASVVAEVGVGISSSDDGASSAAVGAGAAAVVTTDPIAANIVSSGRAGLAASPIGASVEATIATAAPDSTTAAQATSGGGAIDHGPRLILAPALVSAGTIPAPSVAANGGTQASGTVPVDLGAAVTPPPSPNAVIATRLALAAPTVGLVGDCGRGTTVPLATDLLGLDLAGVGLSEPLGSSEGTRCGSSVEDVVLGGASAEVLPLGAKVLGDVWSLPVCV